jgi:hypothetical protein
MVVSLGGVCTYNIYIYIYIYIYRAMLDGHGFGTACPLPAQACIPQGLKIFGGRRPATPASSAARPLAIAAAETSLLEFEAAEAEQMKQKKEAEDAVRGLVTKDASNEKAAPKFAFLQADAADKVVDELRALLGQAGKKKKEPKKKEPKKKAKEAKVPAKAPKAKVAKAVAKAKGRVKKPAKWLRERPTGCSKCRHTPGCSASCWARGEA